MRRTLTFGLLLAGAMLTGSSALASIFVTSNLPPEGVQSYGGPLGDDFTVGSQDLTVSAFGVFDAGESSLTSPVTGYIYPLGGGTPLFQWTFPTGTLSNGAPYVWTQLALPLTLLAGQSYTLVAEGYQSPLDNSNSNTGSTITFSQAGYTLDQSRYGSTPGLYPDQTPGIGENWHFGDANIEYTISGAPAIPEPATVIVWSLLGFFLVGARVWRRRGNPLDIGSAGRRPWSEENRVAIRGIVERGR